MLTEIKQSAYYFYLLPYGLFNIVNLSMNPKLKMVDLTEAK